MAAVLKTVSPKGDVGSNPTPSARKFAAQILLVANSLWLVAYGKNNLKFPFFISNYLPLGVRLQ